MLALAIAALAQQVLRVTNIDAGAEVRYPLVLLRGDAAKDETVAVGVDWKHMVRFPSVNRQFTALVELRPGANMVLLTSGRETLKLRLDYRPMKSPYHVASIYLIPKDETSAYDAPPGVPDDQYGEKLDTAMKLLQCFTAEAMMRAGYGRKTFPLEFDAKGRVDVHVVRSEKLGADLRAMDGDALWSHFYKFLEPTFPYEVNRCCAVMSFTRYSRVSQKPLAHTALGGGGLGLFGGASMTTWPTTLADVPRVFSDASMIDPARQFDDSGLRGTMWASASTTLGAMLHEMGHTFGLPHSVEPLSVMSRGFDHINRTFTLVEPPTRSRPEPFPVTADSQTIWSPFHAARLNWNRWFQPDGNQGRNFSGNLPPRIEFDAAKGEYLISAPYGIRVAGAEAEGRIATFEEFRESAPTILRLNRADLERKIGGVPFRVVVEDDQGNEVGLEVR